MEATLIEPRTVVVVLEGPMLRQIEEMAKSERRYRSQMIRLLLERVLGEPESSA